MLMEKKARKEEEKPRLSTGQKIGVGAAGLIGVPLGMQAAISPVEHSKAYRDYLTNAKGVQAFKDSIASGDVVADSTKKMNEVLRVAKRRQQTIQAVGGVLGATAAGFGAKKLFDRYNARKQEKKNSKSTGDESFLSKVKAGLAASRYSPEQIKQLGASGHIARPKRSQEKKAGIELSIPKLHDRTKADDLRSVFGNRLKHMSDEDVVREYASRTENKGRLYGGILGGAIGSGALGATLGGGLLGSGDVDTSSITKGDLRRRVLGGALGAGVGAYLGGRYGRDHAYHVSDAAIPVLRKQLEDED